MGYMGYCTSAIQCANTLLFHLSRTMLLLCTVPINMELIILIACQKHVSHISLQHWTKYRLFEIRVHKYQSCTSHWGCCALWRWMRNWIDFRNPWRRLQINAISHPVAANAFYAFLEPRAYLIRWRILYICIFHQHYYYAYLLLLSDGAMHTDWL